MKIRHLDWSEKDQQSEWSATAFDGGWVKIIIFQEGNVFHAHTENRDPSERLLSGSSLEEVKALVQKYHEDHIKVTFGE